MKRLYIILLLFVYCLSATGATFYLHYCFGKVDDISFMQKTEEDSSCPASCPMSQKSASEKPEKKEIPGCCDEQKVAAEKTTGHHVLSTLNTVPDLLPAILLVLQYQFGFSGHVSGQPMLSPDISPPDVRQSPLYVLNCTYRI